MFFKTKTKADSSCRTSLLGAIGAFTCCFLAIIASNFSVFHCIRWLIVQWLPRNSVTLKWQQTAWDNWERQHRIRAESSISKSSLPVLEEIPVVDVQDHLHDLLSHLERTYGVDWRQRPLLLRNLWSQDDLSNHQSRRLSLEGLLKENLTIPYFTDATKEGALSPDDSAPIGDIVASISRGAPYKIGTQLLLQAYPEIIREVAPTEIVTDLFGSYFTPGCVKGSGPFGLFPALTTVPLFVANGRQTDSIETKLEEKVENDSQLRPFTALHCEPIGNIAVQLSGKKKWTLIRPEFSYLLQPSAAPDGRAFFVSLQSTKRLVQNQVPTYAAITEAGDAIWVPCWTWHRVDYIESKEVAIGASLFHFRPVDFFQNNPLFALTIIPAVLLELVGYKTQ